MNSSLPQAEIRRLHASQVADVKAVGRFGWPRVGLFAEGEIEILPSGRSADRIRPVPLKPGWRYAVEREISREDLRFSSYLGRLSRSGGTVPETSRPGDPALTFRSFARQLTTLEMDHAFVPL